MERRTPLYLLQENAGNIDKVCPFLSRCKNAYLTRIKALEESAASPATPTRLLAFSIASTAFFEFFTMPAPANAIQATKRGGKRSISRSERLSHSSSSASLASIASNASSASSNASTRSKRNRSDTVTQTSSKAKHIRSDMPDEDSDNSFSDMPPLKDVDDDDGDSDDGDSDDAENSDNEVDEDEDDDVVVIGDEDDAQMKAKLGMPFFFLHCMLS